MGEAPRAILMSGETLEGQLPKLKVAGSNPVSRSKKIKDLADSVRSFFAFLVAFASVWRKKRPE